MSRSELGTEKCVSRICNLFLCPLQIGACQQLLSSSGIVHSLSCCWSWWRFGTSRHSLPRSIFLGRCRARNFLRLDKYRNSLSCSKPKRSMPKDYSELALCPSIIRSRQVSLTSQHRSDLSRVSRNTNISTLIRGEQILNSSQRPLINRLIRFPERSTPQRILLSKTLFERPIRIMAMNNRLATPPIARVHTDGFSEGFLDRRDERMVFWEIKPGKCDAGCGHATEEGTCVVGFWGGHFLVFDLSAPE